MQSHSYYLLSLCQTDVAIARSAQYERPNGPTSLRPLSSLKRPGLSESHKEAVRLSGCQEPVPDAARWVCGSAPTHSESTLCWKESRPDVRVRAARQWR